MCSLNSWWLGAGPSKMLVEATCMWAPARSMWRKDESSPLSLSPFMGAMFAQVRLGPARGWATEAQAAMPRRSWGSDRWEGCERSLSSPAKPATRTPSRRTGRGGS